MHDLMVSQVCYWTGFVIGGFTLLVGSKLVGFRIIKKAQLERIKTLCSNNFMAWEEADKEVKRLRQLEKHYQEVIIELQTKRLNMGGKNAD